MASVNAGENDVVEDAGGHRHGAVDAGPALLQALEDDDPGVEIDPVGGERQRLGDLAAGVGEHEAQGADLPRRPLGDGEEGRALLGREILAPALGVVEPDALGSHRSGR